jgi:hypothetical protein
MLSSQSTTGTMIAACAALVILINATYQGGDHAGFPPFALKWAVRVAAIALVPLAVVAIYGLALRIGQYGLSVERIQAMACLVVGTCYAAGYAWAAVSRGRWMARLELTNWVAAHIAVVVLIAIFSPAVDPARMSVASQIGRLQAGTTPVSTFDFAYLRFKTGHWGEVALKRLADDAAHPEIAARARAELARKSPWEDLVLTPAQRTAMLKVIGDPLPPSFLSQAWPKARDPVSDCPRPGNPIMACFAMAMDVDGTPGAEVIVFLPFGATVYGLTDSRWRQVGSLHSIDCKGVVTLKDAAPGKLLAPTLRSEVSIGGRRLAFLPRPDCGSAAGASDDVTDVALIKPVR